MPQVFIPGGSYRLHTSPVDMARVRMANQFGLRGLMGSEDPRSIPARGPSVVLPLVRGKDGWFYLGAGGHRAQTRGIGWIGDLGDAAADYAAIAAQMAPGSADQILFEGCAANPTAPACASAAAGALSTPYLTGAEYEATVAAINAGQAPPSVVAYTGAPPGTTLPTPPPAPMTPQETASAITGQPNQSVPPSTPLSVLPTGTGAAGGNPLLQQHTQAAAPSSNTGLLVLLGIGAVVFLMGRKK